MKTSSFFKIFQTPAFQVGLVLILIKYVFDSFAISSKTPHVKIKNELVKPVYGATITIQEAENKSTSLFSAMSDVGTDEYLVFEVLDSLKNVYDYNMVYNQFGLRKYVSVLGYGDRMPFFDYTNSFKNPHDLNFWLLNELTEKEISKYKEKFNISL